MDLDAIFQMVEGIADALFHNSDAEHLRDAANRWIGLSTVVERRFSVLECPSKAAGPDATTRDAALPSQRGNRRPIKSEGFWRIALGPSRPTLIRSMAFRRCSCIGLQRRGGCDRAQGVVGDRLRDALGHIGVEKRHTCNRNNRKIRQAPGLGVHCLIARGFGAYLRA